MEWREHTSVSCKDAFDETRRWIEEVTSKSFGSSNFRAALENGVLLCDLMNKLKPGIIKRLNRLSTPIAGLDNVNVFLKACSKLGLNESQLFHPGDLQDLSTRATLRREEGNRRLKNVLITVYWLGRRAQLDPFYCGPQLCFKAFEGLLGLALSKALEEGSGLCPRDGAVAEKESGCRVLRPPYRRNDSLEILEYGDHRGHAHRPGSEGSDVEADQVFSMSTQQQRDRCSVPPALLRRKRGREEGGRGCPSPLTRVSQIQLRPGRPPQVNPGWIWSKSTSDIPIGTRGYEEEENRPRHPQHGTRSKESVEKWQEDLTKWKNRRRSTNSDLHRKFQEREPVVKTTSSGTVTVTGQNKTPHGHSKRDQLSPSKPGPTPTSSTSSASSSPPSSKASHPALRPHSRAPLHRGYTVETLLRDPGPPAPASCSPAHDQPRITPVAASCSPAQNQSGAMPTSHPTLLEEELPAASLPSDSSSSSATTPSACSPYTSQTHIKLRSGPATLPPAATAGLTQPEGRARRSTMGPYPYQSAGSADHHTPPSRPVADRKVTSLHHGLFPGGGRDAGSQKNHGSLTPGDPGTWEEAGGLGKGPAHHSSLYRYNSTSWSSSASLPRGYRRSEGSARLTTVLTARPFGTQPSRGSSLPRLATYRDSISSTHPLQGGDRKTPPLSGDECRSLQPTLSRQVATSNITPPSRHAQNRHSGREQEVAKEQEEEVEGQRQNGLPDRSDPPRSSEAVASDTHLPPPANHGAPPRRMRVSLSLKPNSVDDFGFQTDWTAAGARVTSVQRGSPAEVCQLCVGDVITAVGGARVEQMISGQWESTMSSALHAGSLAMDVNRYSNQGGSGTGVDGTRKTLNLCADVPMLIGCPDRHAPNHDIVATPTAPLLPAQGANVQIRNGECEGTRKTALSKELEGILLRNQQRRAEFFSVKGGTESAISDLQVPSLNPSASSWSWDHEEERKRQVRWQEEQERHLQERYQRDQQRLQAEWQRAQEGEEPRESKGRSGWKGNPGVGRSPSPTRPAASRPAQHWATETRSLRVQNTDPGPARPQSADPAPVRPQSADPAPVRPQGAETGSGKEVQPPAKPDLLRSTGSAGFSQLSSADRVKSKSTPTLASLPKGLGEPRKPSKAEKDRQQILEEMKKRTQLLTDNSWIRQRTPIALKEPLFTGSLRRYESLDSLHPSSASDPFSSDLAGVCRPLSATGFSGPGRSISPRYTTCSALPDQLTTPITSSSQLFLPESTGLSRQAGSACAVASILEEESDQKSEFALETTSLSVNVAASNSSFPAADLVM